MKKHAVRLPKYQLLSVAVATSTSSSSLATSTMTQLQSALSGCEPSMLLLLSHGHSMGLHFWQDAAEPQRIMFDATQFNQLAGNTSSKGIKGDFLTRLKRKLEEQTASAECR